MIKVGDLVKIKGDKRKGRVVDITERMVPVPELHEIIKIIFEDGCSAEVWKEDIDE